MLLQVRACLEEIEDARGTSARDQTIDRIEGALAQVCCCTCACLCDAYETSIFCENHEGLQCTEA